MQKSKDDYLLLDDEEYDDSINKLIEKTIVKDWDTIEEDLENTRLQKKVEHNISVIICLNYI